MAAYYNEKDEFAAQWLRNLIAAGHIAPGDVDERSIEDVIPVELAKYTQCHFFAGIGVWSYSMRRAGWPDDRHAWSGSCPCQPFSAAGKGAGFADERHLWPAFFHLIEQCGPAVVFGEQVASADGLAWLDLVQTDMEAANYAFGALDTCAAGFGAPHIRQRLYWMAYARLAQQRSIGRTSCETSSAPPWQAFERVGTSSAVWLANPRLSEAERQREHSGEILRKPEPERLDFRSNPTGGLAYDVVQQRSDARSAARAGTTAAGWDETTSSPTGLGSTVGPGPTNGFWRDADWLACRDERWRPVEPGTFPLAHGATSRVGRLRGYGNAIVAPQAEEFLRVAMAYAP